MCRFFSYLGQESLMHDVMYQSGNSLIEQSKYAKKREQPVNGDGFGIGWYPAHADPQPGTYVATTPAWSDRNLANLCAKIKTSCFFAHVRDASHGMPVSSTNCHPFQYGHFLWMHNGYIDQFGLIKRAVIDELSDRAFLQIHGNTDSEFAFALFLDQIEFNDLASLQEIEGAMRKTIEVICRILKQHDIKTKSFLNFVVSNGKNLVSTRFTSNLDNQPPSLFYTFASFDCLQNNRMKMQHDNVPQSVIIASEPITSEKEFWHKIDRNQMVSVSDSLEVNIQSLICLSTLR